MYYGKQSNYNHDYYNTYRDSSYQYNNGKNYLTVILKVLLILLLLAVLFVGFILLSNRVETEQDITQTVQKENILEEKQQNSISTKNSISASSSKEQVSLTQDDIANIVTIVMHKLDANDNKKDSKVSDDDAYTHELLLQDVDKLSSNAPISVDKVDVKKVVDNQKLSRTNHYNKVVINKPQEEKYTNDTLSRLSIELSAINEESDNSSSYTKEISKEISVRSNEMRIIVVKKGDTLSKIAKRAYGNYDDYVKIFEANPEIIKNPNKIYVGQKLRIPL